MAGEILRSREAWHARLLVKDRDGGRVLVCVEHCRLVLAVARRDWVVPVAVTIADATIGPVDHELDVLPLGLRPRDVDGVSLGVVTRACATGALAPSGPTTVRMGDNVNVALRYRCTPSLVLVAGFGAPTSLNVLNYLTKSSIDRTKKRRPAAL